MIRVASLDELRAKRMIVVKGDRCPILVVCHDDRVYALDNRCPHLMLWTARILSAAAYSRCGSRAGR
ncbi:MAG TPA: Rieske 2Fe-2S domain-containing protein [Bradyrhizobium sp.]|nr:Rieske 2Fe-2S domain-containing protein [Bradyrhizobium sp.]